MGHKPLIKKASGETEPFSREKFEASLRRAGVDESVIESVTAFVMSTLYDGIPTRKIYAKAFALLRKRGGASAARYKLKQAIMELGPTGYPFEYFIGQLFKEMGYSVKTGQTLEGRCVTHEIDVVATNEHTQCLVECKFHNSQGKISNVQVPLYVRSRMDDIIDNIKGLSGFSHLKYETWVITNTRFSSDALKYGECSGLKLMGWDMPEDNSLKKLIEKMQLFPVTSLVNLTKKHKSMLAEKGIVLCRQLAQAPFEIEGLGLPNSMRRKLEEELKALI